MYRCHNGYTPLLTALYANNFEVMDVLLRRGAKVDEPEPFGSTALHIACGQGNLEVVRLFFLLFPASSSTFLLSYVSVTHLLIVVRLYCMVPTPD